MDYFNESVCDNFIYRTVLQLTIHHDRISKNRHVKSLRDRSIDISFELVLQL